MKQFILKASFFIIPFFLLSFISLHFYTDTEGDLLRIGYIPDNNIAEYKQNFFIHNNDLIIDKEKFEILSEPKNKKFKILTIGDSFSEQGPFGYKNILANDFSVLHVDRFISDNQIQTLINLVNGDFFDKYDIEYVILENVERDIIDNIKDIRLTDKIMLHQIDSLIQNHKRKEENNAIAKEESLLPKLFSKSNIKFPLYCIPKFIFQKNYLSNEQVYNVELNSNSYFSNNSSKLLFYIKDLESTELNNNKKNIDRLNIIFNTISSKLRKKNIKLITLPTPDKYDAYYDYIAEKKDFTKPIFFNLMKTTKKDYIYIDSKEILEPKIKSKQKDIYFFDDSHWSPIASKIIAEKIKTEIETNRSERNYN